MIPYTPMSPAELQDLEARYGRELDAREAEFIVRNRCECHDAAVVERQVMPSEHMPELWGKRTESVMPEPHLLDACGASVVTGAHRAVNECELTADSLCEECDHPIRLHGKYGCEHEGGDRLVVGTNGVEALMASGPCGCTTWEEDTSTNLGGSVHGPELGMNRATPEPEATAQAPVTCEQIVYASDERWPWYVPAAILAALFTFEAWLFARYFYVIRSWF